MADFYEWTIKIRVAPSLVADGLDLTADRMRQIVCRGLPYVSESAIDIEVVSAPPADDVAKEQGYSSAAVRDMIKKMK